ncbi:hypothetical protein LY90DRAFT_705678 [Neocallimastix californiae]|uniref:Endoglucanase n=1 Tax=Neocallimastix californiae TaxID=1754190 RepID=A0A1Y2B143_9FUNG|nr:hypothetical protein LY90DRAFT_705678 [Neocallimastix californiae]|eukprot:ORY28533.1 hypothetical protein LY90DRAFT_705678 [Neocallimastix californiae]
MRKYTIISILGLLTTNVIADNCWSESLGYPCCTKTTEVVSEDSDGQWGLENDNWCGIVSSSPEKECFSTPDYPCCSSCQTIYSDNDGDWGCGIKDSCKKTTTTTTTTPIKPSTSPTPQQEDSCWAEKLGYKCCKECTVTYNDENGDWGFENGDWCGILRTCTVNKDIDLEKPYEAIEDPKKIHTRDYARILNLNLRFYECNWSGKAPEHKQVYWRYDSALEDGADVGLDLSIYYDAGDHVKFNLPMSYAMTMLAWGGIDLYDNYVAAGQIDYLVQIVNHGADYFVKCHPEKEVIYAQVGLGDVDHCFWVPPELMTMERPAVCKLTPENGASDVTAQMAAALASASILNKMVGNTEKSELYLKHAIEIYDFADKYRDVYGNPCPEGASFYPSASYKDELVWGAAWVYRASGDEKYYEKADSYYDSLGLSGRVLIGPISWDDAVNNLINIILVFGSNWKRYLGEAQTYVDQYLNDKSARTDAGMLWYSAVSGWGSARHAMAGVFLYCIFNTYHKPTDPKYFNFIQQQADYILGNNPFNRSLVVGSIPGHDPLNVHHRGSHGGYSPISLPEHNMYTLYGALAGGPLQDDSWDDDRNNYITNEVSCDYNAGVTGVMAYLTPWTVPDNFEIDESEPEADAHLILNIEKTWADVYRIIADVETKLPTPAWEVEFTLPEGHVFDDYSATNCEVVSYDEKTRVLRFKNTPWNGPLTANLTESFGFQCHGLAEEVSDDGKTILETKDRDSE